MRANNLSLCTRSLQCALFAVCVCGGALGVAGAWLYGIGRADFLLREGGFLVGATENSLPHDRKSALP